MTTLPPVVLTIAGTDPSGGAGIQADLRAFQHLGIIGTSVITAALAQNSQGVLAIHPLPPRFVARQLDAVVKDVTVSAVKIGMLSGERIVSTVAERIVRRKLPNIVLDPVLCAKDGRSLLTAGGRKRLVSELLPKTLVLTPNMPEAAVLTGKPVASLDDAKEACRVLFDMGPRFVIVKGGHRSPEEPPIDLLFDGVKFLELAGERIPGRPVRGTGCLFSAALAAHIALGRSVPEAALEAKSFVTDAIRNAVTVGKGHPVWFDSMGAGEEKRK